jgi:hypothetical protein
MAGRDAGDADARQHHAVVHAEARRAEQVSSSTLLTTPSRGGRGTRRAAAALPDGNATRGGQGGAGGGSVRGVASGGPEATAWGHRSGPPAGARPGREGVNAMETVAGGTGRGGGGSRQKGRCVAGGGGAAAATRGEIDPGHLTGLQPGDSENERQLRQTAPTDPGGARPLDMPTKCVSPKLPKAAASWEQDAWRATATCCR